MKEYTVTIDYDNVGYVCQYLYINTAININQAINDALEEFKNFMNENGRTVEIVEIDAWIRRDEF